MSETEPEQSALRKDVQVEKQVLLDLFRRGKMATELEEQRRIAGEFERLLFVICTPPGSTSMESNPEQVRKILFGRNPDEKKYFGGDYLALGSGTAGQRIYIVSEIDIYPSDGDHLVRGAHIMQQFSGFTRYESGDGKPRWMQYRKPSGTDWYYGKKYWERYIQVFGNELVDLTG